MDIAVVGHVESLGYSGKKKGDGFTDPRPEQCVRTIKLSCESTVTIIPLDQPEALMGKSFDIVYLDPLASEEMKHTAAYAVMATDGRVEVLV
jgi:hypothetical protein